MVKKKQQPCLCQFSNESTTNGLANGTLLFQTIEFINEHSTERKCFKSIEVIYTQFYMTKNKIFVQQQSSLSTVPNTLHSSTATKLTSEN